MSSSRSVAAKDKVAAILSFSKVPRTNPAVLLPDSGTQPKVFARLPASWFNTVHPKFVWGFQHAVNFQYRERNIGCVKYQTLIQTSVKKLVGKYGSHFVSVIHLHKQPMLMLFEERNLHCWSHTMTLAATVDIISPRTILHNTVCTLQYCPKWSVTSGHLSVTVLMSGQYSVCILLSAETLKGKKQSRAWRQWKHYCHFSVTASITCGMFFSLNTIMLLKHGNHSLCILLMQNISWWF